MASSNNPMSRIMTEEELATKDQLFDLLGKQGYKTYAQLFDKFALHLTEDPGVIAYMVPDKGIIVINRFLLLSQISTVLRHEILHQYLEHGKRELAKLKNRFGDDFEIDANVHELSNIAADFEVSNRGYTNADKRTVRNLRLNGEVLGGLVTEDGHPDWVDLTYEEMLDKLLDESDADAAKLRKQVMIGDRGNEAKQKAEAVARAAQIQKERAEASGDDATAAAADSLQDAANDITDAINKTTGQGDNSGNDSKNTDPSHSSGTAGNEPSTADKVKGAYSDYSLSADELAQIEATLKRIEELLDDPATLTKLDKEHERRIFDSEEEVRERAAKAERVDPLNQFISSLAGFIAKQTAIGRDASWKRTNPVYSRQGIVRPGKARTMNKKIPLVQLYYDRSGSWAGDVQKEEIGRRGRAVLEEYERKGLIKVEDYWFDTRVRTNEREAGGGTAGQPILDNIIKTEPDNVVIITDSDINDCTSKVTVPGAVWLLFVDGVSDNLIAHIHGEQLTEKFEIWT